MRLDLNQKIKLVTLSSFEPEPAAYNSSALTAIPTDGRSKIARKCDSELI